MSNINMPTAAKSGNEKESFESLLEEVLGCDQFVGTVLRGRVVGFEKDLAVIDVGLKSEGRVPMREFSVGGKVPEMKVGDSVDVFVERMEGANGEIGLSHEKARREASWIELEKSFKENHRVNGVMFGKVKGGFTVDLNGAIAFLPGSQVDIRPIRDIDALMNIEQPFMILKMDRARGNIVVSRRSVLEESRAEQREELVSELEEGKIIEGIVKNITDYGAFVDLGGIDGLLHVTDISWQRINHPSEVLQLGQSVKVQIVRFNKETQRISLGMKQLTEDPWKGLETRYKVGTKISGKVSNITDYGAFVELEEGVEGLIHVSEMSWTKKNIHPSKVVTLGQQVEVMILELEPEKRRIALGLKQTYENPWETVQTKYPIGSVVEGEIRNITEFGMFVNLEGDIDGMVHMSDLSWEKSGDAAIKDYKKGDKIQVKILEIDPSKERVAMGVKQLSGDPFEEASQGLSKGQIVTCEVTEIQEDGIAVKIADRGLHGFIRRAELSKDRTERRPDRFAVGEKVDAQIINVDRGTRKMTLSIKALEIEEQKEAMDKYGSADSGASLGDILGAALEKKKKAAEKSSAEAAPAEKKPAAKKATAKKDADKAEKKEPAEKKAPAKKKVTKKAEEEASE